MNLEQLKERKAQLEDDVRRYKNLQGAKKVQLNSAYGALGNQWFRFYDIRLAESITFSGQLSINWIERKLNEYMNQILKTEGKDYIIASDTDSVYIDFETLVDKYFPNKSDEQIVEFLDKISKEKIQPFINKSYEELAERLNSYTNRMDMKREVIANKGIWTAKKKYILNVHDSEGVRYDTPELKMTGIETVKSSTPESCRDALEKAIGIIINGDEKSVQEYIENFREKFYKMRFEEIAFPTSITDLTKYENAAEDFPKGCPIHVRSAIIFNKMLKHHKLTKRFESIKDGEKIKYCYLKVPNPSGQYVMGVISTLPKEFGLEKYIDYDEQFAKAFLSPLNSILEKIGWNAENVASLDDFFG